MWEEIIQAIKNRNITKATKLIKQISYEDLSKRKDNKGYTVLDHAVKNDHVEVCKLLFEIELKAIDDSNTLLHLAAEGGLDKECELLMSKMTLEAINAVNKDGNTALHAAAKKSHGKVC